MSHTAILSRRYGTEKRKNVISDCKILYAGKPFIWECGHGWDIPLAELSYALEELNVRFRKFGVRIRAVQVKEKFGTLRFYYDIETVPLLWRRLPRMAVDAVCGFMEKAFRPCLSHPAGRIFASPPLNLCKKLSRFLHALETEKPSRVRHIIAEYMDAEAERLIERTETECENLCEECGIPFSDTVHKCVTKGWIRILCEKCVPDGAMYVKDGKKCVAEMGNRKDSPDEDQA